MKNKIIRNIIKGIIFPIPFILVGIIYLFNDMGIRESYNDMFKGYW